IGKRRISRIFEAPPPSLTNRLRNTATSHQPFSWVGLAKRPELEAACPGFVSAGRDGHRRVELDTIVELAMIETRGPIVLSQRSTPLFPRQRPFPPTSTIPSSANRSTPSSHILRSW